MPQEFYPSTKFSRGQHLTLFTRPRFCWPSNERKVISKKNCSLQEQQEQKERKEGEAFWCIYLTSQILEAALQLQDPTVAKPVGVEVEGAPPQNERHLCNTGSCLSTNLT